MIATCPVVSKFVPRSNISFFLVLLLPLKSDRDSDLPRSAVVFIVTNGLFPVRTRGWQVETKIKDLFYDCDSTAESI